MFFKDFLKIIQETFIIQLSVWIHILTHLIWKKNNSNRGILISLLKKLFVIIIKILICANNAYKNFTLINPSNFWLICSLEVLVELTFCI